MRGNFSPTHSLSFEFLCGGDWKPALTVNLFSSEIISVLQQVQYTESMSPSFSSPLATPLFLGALMVSLLMGTIKDCPDQCTGKQKKQRIVTRDLKQGYFLSQFPVSYSELHVIVIHLCVSHNAKSTRVGDAGCNPLCTCVFICNTSEMHFEVQRLSCTGNSFNKAGSSMKVLKC